MTRTYSELIQLPTFEERFEYLKLVGKVGQETFGYDRYLNQILYTSPRWRKLRNEIIIRDNACNLAVLGFCIFDKVIIHHMNPITVEDVENGNEDVYNPEYLVCVSNETHNAIHYGNRTLLPKVVLDRKPGDTRLW